MGYDIWKTENVFLLTELSLSLSLPTELRNILDKDDEL